MVEIRMPEAGFNITEGKIVQWYKNSKDKVEEGENVVSVETDKITVDIPAEKAGVLFEIRCKEGDVVPVGAVLGVITEESDSTAAIQKKIEEKFQTPVGEEKELPQPVVSVSDKIAFPDKKISPAAKAVARKEGVDLSRISSGTGPGGRIVREDVLKLIETQSSEEVPSMIAGKIARRVEYKEWRKVIADRVTKSSREVPQCTVAIEVDVTELSRIISSIREKESVHITYLPFIMKAIARGIELFPELNAFCDDKGFTLLSDVNVGIVVNVEGKLLIPVVKAVKEKRIIDLAREIEDLVEKAHNNRLERNDIDGGTITITNVGPFQIHSGTALIFQPQAAIVLLMAAREIPAVWNGNVAIRKRMNIGVTYDHRVIDGALCGKFLMEVRSCIEDPNLFFVQCS
ncbi:MAG: 2-oxo acid dehydrogenase subunit E2 [Spirochaetota bacterium]|nr:MAG: 2-oxo acid dehydrogenase subunit E2 [Spirochaetota bacterium]